MAKDLDDLDSYIDAEAFDAAAADEAAGTVDDAADTGLFESASGVPLAPTKHKHQPPARAVVIFSLLVAVVAVCVAIYFAGRPNPAGTQSDPHAGMPVSSRGPATPSVDTAAEKELLAQLEKNPHELTVLRKLAKVYLLGEDAPKAIEIEKRVIALAPGDVDAHLELGVAYFGMRDLPNAEKAWKRVLELDSANIEAHYNLGFLYMSSEPPRADEMEQHWQQVVQRAPNSDMAKTVSGHLSRSQSTSAPTAKKS